MGSRQLECHPHMLRIFFFGDKIVNPHPTQSIGSCQLWVQLKYKKAPVLPTGCIAAVPIFLFPKRLASDSFTSWHCSGLLFHGFHLAHQSSAWLSKIKSSWLRFFTNRLIFPIFYIFWMLEKQNAKQTQCNWCLQSLYLDFLRWFSSWRANG